jgi:hypothetical protein
VVAGGALGFGFADAEDRVEAGCKGGGSLAAHLLVRLMLVGAALGMADDDEPTARLPDHRRRDVARVGPARRLVAVLRADADAAPAPRHGSRDQGEGRADGDIGARGGASGLGDRHQFL